MQELGMCEHLKLVSMCCTFTNKANLNMPL